MPYRAIVRIVPAGEERLNLEFTTAVQWNTNYLAVYQNPLFWILNFSPLFVYMSEKVPDQASMYNILGVDEDIVFKFKKESIRRHFVKKAPGVLKVFLNQVIVKSNIGQGLPLNSIFDK